MVAPSYNHGQFLEQTIKSVLDQENPNLEYIFMDGGSNDNSVEIIKKHENIMNSFNTQSDKHWLTEDLLYSTLRM